MPAANATVKTRVYGSDGLVSKADSSSVFFGTVGPNMDSEVVVIDMVVEGAVRVSNIRLGVVGGDLTNKNVGNILLVEARTSFSTVKPSQWVNGINGSGTLDDAANLRVGVRGSTANESNYVALMVKGPERPMSSCAMQFRWFFDFE